MNQLTTTGIILGRTDFGEADRIITLLTPDQGKLRLLARGVRRVKSKLAGGIELFSVSSITFARGRGDIGTLVSARLVRHYGRIVGDLERTMAGYELIKQLNKVTEDEPEQQYFELLDQAFAALDDTAIALPLIRWWFSAQLLRLGGHTPNLQTDTSGNVLDAAQTYHFDFEAMTFVPAFDADGSRRGGKPATDALPGLPRAGQFAPATFAAVHIKFLRLGFGGTPPHLLARIAGSAELTLATAPSLATMLAAHLRV